MKTKPKPAATRSSRQQQADMALGRLQYEHQWILDAVGDGLHGIDLDGRIIFENPAAATMLGWEIQALTGKPAHSTMHHTRADGPPYPQSECPIYATLRDGVSRHVEDEVFWRKDGTSFPVAYTSTAMRDDAGEIVGVIVDFLDITERKRAEAALVVAKERAQSADRIKSAFLATMSHELRTPLNSIVGFTGIILQGLAGPLNEEQSKQLGMVQNSARHLLALINDVLDLSKIEAGQLEIANEEFDLSASITKVVSMVKPLSEKKGLDMKVQIAPEIGRVAGDERRVEQILLNLLSNAIKFTEHGQILLSAEIIDDFRPPGSSSTRSAISMSVSDSGMGITPENLATLFQPFRQIDSGLSRNHEGTGLGLVICRRLADLMGGEIRAESIHGAGSTFTFIFPLDGEEEK